jgi:hypothetical protein
MPAFKPVPPREIPPAFADERIAWEGPLPEMPGQLFRIEAAAYAGKPVYFVLNGNWSAGGTAPPGAALFNTVIANAAGLVMPGLMVAGAVLARRNVKLGRGDRSGALRAATVVFVATMAAWVLGRHVTPFGADLQRFFSAVGGALFSAALLWLTYLGLEPYVRRHSPDSLIGWTRLIAGRWQDPRVGADVMIGVSAGLAMTVLVAAHNIIPMWMGRTEPMPLLTDSSALLGTRDVLRILVTQFTQAIQSSMLGVVGLVALLIWLKRPWLAIAAGIICFTPVALSGMFPGQGTPVLDMIIGAGIIAIFVVTIVRAGLLATMAALTTHFILLRAPVTLDLSSWRAPLGFWFLGTIALAGFGAVYIARNGHREAEGRA